MITLKYKGGRDYIHGSDMFLWADSSLQNTFSGFVSHMSFRNFARSQCEIMLTKPAPSSVVATGRWADFEGTKEIPFWIVETECPIEENYPYDESKITEAATIEGDKIEANITRNHYTVVENVIALTKELNYFLSPNVVGKWVFGQIDLKAPLPPSAGKIGIFCRSMIANKFSRNTIYIEGEEIGEIRFIVGKP